MYDSHSEIIIRHPFEHEIDMVFDFMISCDVADYGEPDSDKGDLADLWKEVNLSKDAWIAVSELDQIVAYALVLDEGERFHWDLYSNRLNTPIEVVSHLLDLCEEHVRERAAEKRDIKPIKIVGYVTGVNKISRAAFEGKGFTDHQHHYRMQIDFHEPVIPPAWRNDFQVRPYQPEDEKELYELISSTFDWSGREPTTIDQWRKHLFRNGRYDPKYFIMVRHSERLVGAALSYAEDAGGWIRQLAIVKDLQGKGLGSRLLRHMMSIFYNNGLPSCALGVSAANENALEFYKRNGMRQTREFIEYRKQIIARE